MTEKRQFEAAPVELRSQTGGRLPLICGYAAIFNARSSPLHDKNGVKFIETIRAGAFLRSLMLVATGELDVLARYDHKVLLGRTSNGTLAIFEDSHGLRYEISPSATSGSRDLVELIRKGYINGSSFEFNTNRESWRSEAGQRIRELHDVTLLDVGPTARPAYKATSSKVWQTGQAGLMQMQLELAHVK
jgi:uncharacterized protein